MKEIIKHWLFVTAMAACSISAFGQAENASFEKQPDLSLPTGISVYFAGTSQNTVLHSVRIKEGADEDAAGQAVRTSTPSPFFNEDISQSADKFQSPVEVPVTFREFSPGTDQFSPPDNTIAVSNTGFVVSCMNSNYSVFNPGGTGAAVSSSFKDALASAFPALTDVYHNPKVIYDAENDRFVISILNGTNSKTSHIVLMFSKSGNPADGWNAYQLVGDMFKKAEWADDVNIGVSKSDLFLTANLYDDSSKAIEAGILQVRKADGYAGGNLNLTPWEPVKTTSSKPLVFGLAPAPHGLGGDYGDNMYFVSNTYGAGNTVRLYEISGSQVSGNAKVALNIYLYYSFLYYSAPWPSAQKSSKILISSGDARIKQAYYLHNVITFVFSTFDQYTGFTDIVYARLNVNTKVLIHRTFGLNGYNYVFPSIASYGKNDSDKSIIMGYCKGGPAMYPEMDAVYCDSSLTFSFPLYIQHGTAPVIDSPMALWGNYTGMARQYNTNSCYFAGQYAADGGYKTWIAELGLASRAGIASQSSAAADVVLYPNPASSSFRLVCSASGHIPAVISLYDMQGRLVKTLFEGMLQSGGQQFDFNTSDISRGIYQVAIRSNNASPVIRRIVID